MDLVLWRHAEAEEGRPDAARNLTRKGRNQAKEMASWLKPRLTEPWKIISSPLARARETALALTGNFETCDALAAGDARQLLAASGWPRAQGTVIIVGHQPTLGVAASLLLSGREADCSIKKGALWWFRSKGNHAVLIAAMAPELVSGD